MIELDDQPDPLASGCVVRARRTQYPPAMLKPPPLRARSGWVLVILGACFAAANGAAPCEAQGPRARKIEVIRPEIHLNMGYRATFGSGFRLDIPIVPKGWLRSRHVTDEFAISTGADLMFIDTHANERIGVGFWPVVAAQWNLHFNEDWSAFVEGGLAFVFGDDHHHQRFDDDFGVAPAFGIGGRWHFSRRNALVARINYPAGFQFGITF